MTEESARREYLKENTKIDVSAYLAIQEIDYLSDTVLHIQRTIRSDNQHLKEDSIRDLTMLESFNYSKSFVDAVMKAWQLTFGNIKVALEIFKSNSGLQNIMRNAILRDIEENPVDWMNVPRIAALAAYYLNSSEKDDEN